jgi:hypothetical protein
VLKVCLLDSIKAVLLPQCKLKGGHPRMLAV